jgi:uncharacterized membrane protein
MIWLELIRWLHVIGASVLLGTGAGIAFFMLLAHRTDDPRLIAHFARSVVVADMLFTATAVIVQPITGAALAHGLGWSLAEPWIALSLALYVLTGLCWAPVVWIQMRMRNLAAEAANRGEPLPAAYRRLFRIWLFLGFPAFASVLAILWLMLSRPTF